MTDPKPPKTCFIICPIGSPGSPTRLRSNGIYHEVLKRVLTARGYQDPVRGDHDKGPGIVTEKIVRAVIDSDLNSQQSSLLVAEVRRR